MTATALPPGPTQPRAVQAVLWALRYPEFTREAHARFGTTFTVRAGTMPPAVVTTDRDAIRRLLTGDPLAKAHANDVLRPMIGDRSLMLMPPADHLARRKLLLPPFHGERVRAYGRIMQELVDEELDRWRPGDVVAVFPAAQRLALEVIKQAFLGIADEDTRRRLRTLIDDAVEYPFGAVRRRVGHRFDGTGPAQLLTPAVLTYFPEMKVRTRWNLLTVGWWRIRDRLRRTLEELIVATRTDPGLEERDDILAMLVQARDEEGRGLSDRDLSDELVTLISAGHETTAATIAWGADVLAHDAEVRERATSAAEEDDQAYLDALVKEVLRIRPPVPLASARTLSEPFPIGPYTIPPGTNILIDSLGLHSDPSLYPEPDELRPERFLERAPEPYTFLPFGGGAHRCIGAALAELEIKTALGTMLRRVELLPAAPAPAAPMRRAVLLVPKGGGRVRIGSRRASGDRPALIRT